MNATPKRSITSAIFLALANTCPLCERGNVFSGLIRMNERCPNCKVLFEREQGYFTGAMSFSYFLAFFLVLPTFMPLLLSDTSFWVVIGISFFELLLLSPFVFRYSRLLWIHLDRRVNPHD